MAVPNPTGSFPAKTNSAQLPCSFPRPAFWSPLGRNRCRFSRIRPRSPCAGFLSGLGCGRSTLRGVNVARSGRLLARCGRRALGTSASGGATAFRMDGYCRALGFFRKGSAWRSVGGLARAIRAAHGRAFDVRTPIPPLTYRQMVWKREEEYIYTTYFPLFAHIPRNSSVGVSVGDLSAVPTDGVFRHGHLSRFSTDSDTSPTHGADVSTSRHRAGYGIILSR